MPVGGCSSCPAADGVRWLTRPSNKNAGRPRTGDSGFCECRSSGSWYQWYQSAPWGRMGAPTADFRRTHWLEDGATGHKSLPGESPIA